LSNLEIWDEARLPPATSEPEVLDPVVLAPAAPRLKVACLPTGPDEYAAAVIRALAARADVLVIASPAWAARYGGDLPAAVRIATPPWPRHRDPRNLLLAWRILREVRSFAPDVVHFLGESVLWLVLALPWLRRWPLVVTVHEVDFHPGDVQAQTLPMGPIRLFRRAMDGAIVHGRGQAERLAAGGIRPPGGTHIVPHPVLDRHARLAGDAATSEATPSGPRLLFFGRVMLYKGLAVLLAAGDELIRHHPELRLVVAGTGDELDRLRAELARRPWVEVLDAYVPDSAVAGLFQAADIVVLPYIEASQSGVAALAAGFAKPVVASATGELGELVEATGMGLVVPPGEPRALALAIARLLEDAALRAGCSAAAAAAARGPMSPATVAGLTLEAYATIIARRARASR
jgi:glycosyltransferase involved in cell wall biosynthesis